MPTLTHKIPQKISRKKFRFSIKFFRKSKVFEVLEKKYKTNKSFVSKLIPNNSKLNLTL